MCNHIQTHTHKKDNDKESQYFTVVISCMKKNLETGGSGQEGLGMGEAGETGGPGKASLREMKGKGRAAEGTTPHPQPPGYHHAGSVTL